MATKPDHEAVDETANETSSDYVPAGFRDADEFLAEARELYRIDREADQHNFDAAEDDIRFASCDIDGLGQWSPEAIRQRCDLEQSIVTNNMLPQFIGQVVGDRRVNQVSVKVLPREDSDVDVAEIRSDLIRNIEVQSRAERVYGQAFEHEVTCGIGNFRVELDWTGDDVFDRDIFIRPIPNPLSVTWDYMSVDPTGKDAGHCFVEDLMPRKLYEKLYPDTPIGDLGETCGSEWVGKDSVKVTEYWQMQERDRTIALMADGKVGDVTDKQWDEYAAGLFRDEGGQPRIREVKCKYAVMHLITGFAILKPAYELKINRLPIIRCSGREFPVGDRRVRYGLVRFIKDNQRFANFFDSVKVDMLSKAPRQQWFGSADAFEGYEKKFREAYLSGDPILKFNKNAAHPPQMVPPVEYPAAFAQESAYNSQKMRDGSGIHEANLGMRSNETSGVAINARQHEGDIATVIYHDNMNAAVQEAGDVINQLIPQVYDVARTIRVVGADLEERLQRINDPMDPKSVNLATGKYDVTISTGPAYQTRRQEASTSMTEFIRAVPEVGALIADKVPKAMDWPDSDEIAERIRKHMIKAGLIEDENNEGGGQGGQPNQEQMLAAQQQQQAMQMQQMAEEAQQMQMQAEITKATAEAEQAQANARKAEADADKAEIEAHRAAIELGAGVGTHLNSFSAAGQPDPATQPQPGNATRTRNPGRQRRK